MNRRPTNSNVGVILVAMTLANAMILVDQTAVPLTLPSIIKQYGVGSSAVQWVLLRCRLPCRNGHFGGGCRGDGMAGEKAAAPVGWVMMTGGPGRPVAGAPGTRCRRQARPPSPLVPRRSQRSPLPCRTHTRWL